MDNFTKLKKKSTKEWSALVNSGEPTIYLGMASCGKAAGADNIKKAVIDALDKYKVSAKLVEVGCIGTCYLEPLMDISANGLPRISFGNVSEKMADFIVRKFLVEKENYTKKALGYIGTQPSNGIPNFFDHSMLKSQVRIVTKNCGLIDPENILHYIANDGYSGLVKALKISPRLWSLSARCIGLTA